MIEKEEKEVEMLKFEMDQRGKLGVNQGWMIGINRRRLVVMRDG